jgi:HK97 family phage prohead protease
MSTIKRAYSTLEIKAFDESEGKRRFSGIATTPTADRGGDIVEPKGVEFKLPIPFLWQHRSSEPIGWITKARITDAGIEVDGEVHNEAEPGKLKDRLDEAWQSIRAGLVQGLSIGFKPLEEARIGDTWSYRYLKWLWLELSAVTIAMNGDCSITAIKSADEAIRRAATGARRVVRLDSAPAASGNQQSPGVSGQHAQRRKGCVYL